MFNKLFQRSVPVKFLLSTFIDAAESKVGNTSCAKKNCSDFDFSNTPFQYKTAGTLIPPSYADNLLPLKPPELPLAVIKSGAITLAIGSTSKTGPLSLKNKIIVSSAIPLSSMLFIIFPISLSSAYIFAAYFFS